MQKRALIDTNPQITSEFDRNSGVKLCAVICPTSRLFVHMPNFSLATAQRILTPTLFRASACWSHW